MVQLTWSGLDEAWIAVLSSEHFENLEIVVYTDGETTPPTDVQLQAVSVIEQLAQTGLPDLTEHARRYAFAYLSDEEAEEMQDEDFEIEIQCAVIPRLKDTTDLFILFVGNSDIDMEHGVAVLCKNGRQFAVTHSDIAYTHHPWDDTEEMEQILAG